MIRTCHVIPCHAIRLPHACILQNKSKLDEELADIKNIMKKNINEVLERGDKLERR